jgi:hypothetical protein
MRIATKVAERIRSATEHSHALGNNCHAQVPGQTAEREHDGVERWHGSHPALLHHWSG